MQVISVSHPYNRMSFGVNPTSLTKVVIKNISDNPGKTLKSVNKFAQKVDASEVVECLPEVVLVKNVGEVIYSALNGNGVETVKKSAQIVTHGVKVATGATGAKIGAAIGISTGPLAPVAVPVLSALGYLTGSTIVGWFTNKTIEKGSSLFR